LYIEMVSFQHLIALTIHFGDDWSRAHCSDVTHWGSLSRLDFSPLPRCAILKHVIQHIWIHFS